MEDRNLIKITETGCPVRSPLLDGGADIEGAQKYDIGLQGDGLPLLPVFDIDFVAPNNARSMLKTYIELTWSEFVSS
jgi:hypothetical protein